MKRKNQMKFSSIAIMLVIMASAGCKKESAAVVEAVQEDDEIISAAALSSSIAFQSNFQGNVAVVPTVYTGGYVPTWREDITGSDYTSAYPDNWVTDLPAYQYFSEAYLNYEQGTAAQRKADVIADPTPGASSTNRVMRFRISEGHIEASPADKARIQLELNNKTKPGTATEYWQKVRLYIGSDFNILTAANSTFPSGLDWLNIFEFANNPAWQAGSADASIKVNLTRVNQSGSFVWSVNHVLTASQTSEFYDRNEDFEVPIGQWMTITLWIREGGPTTGRFVFKCKPDGEAEETIFDITDETKFPGSVADGLNSWNPLKLYCAKTVVDRFQNQGKSMNLYWDDLQIRTN